VDTIKELKSFIRGILGKEIIQVNNNRIVSISSTPEHLDNIEARYGCEIYDTMMTDPIVNSSIELLKAKTLSSTYKLINPMQAKLNQKDKKVTQEDFEKAEEIKEYIQNMLNNFSLPFGTLLKELLNSLVYGSIVAEKTFDIVDGKYTITDIKIKPRKTYRFIVDEYNNCVGVSVVFNVFDNGKFDSLVPKEKLIIFSHNPLYNNPYGISLLRPAYVYWKLKNIALDNYNKYLHIFATPPLVGILPPGLSKDEEGNPLAEVMLRSLVNTQNGIALVIPNGSDVKALEINNSSDVYQKALKYYDNQIISCILKSSRATSEAEFGSKADSQTSSDIITDLIGGLQQSLAETVYDNIFYQIVELNWGKEQAKNYTPKIQFNDSNLNSIIKFSYAISQMWSSGFLDESQKVALDDLMNLPNRAVKTQEQLDAEALNADITRSRASDTNTPLAGGQDNNAR